MIRAIVFDLDDTLISEIEYIKSGYWRIAHDLQYKLNRSQQQIYDELWSLFQSSPIQVFNRLFDKLNIDYSQDDIKHLVQYYREHEPTISFFNDVMILLQQLKQKKIKTGIITDGYSVSQRNKLKSLRAEQYFDEIIVTDELGKEYWKPHPKPFELMRDKLNVDFNEMIYIGDNPAKDFFISSTYPITTIRITRECGVHHQNEYLGAVKEHKRITDLTETLKYL